LKGKEAASSKQESKTERRDHAGLARVFRRRLCGTMVMGVVAAMMVAAMVSVRSKCRSSS
jgi:hypothetical protein